MSTNHIKVGTLNVRSLRKAIPHFITRKDNSMNATALNTTTNSVNSSTSTSTTTSTLHETDSTYLTFLKQHRLDIACFQETRVNQKSSSEYIDKRMHAHQSCWTEHCAILNMNTSLELTPLSYYIGQTVHICYSQSRRMATTTAHCRYICTR
jgi:hypothetical protein